MAHPKDVTLKLTHTFVSLAELVLGARLIFSLVDADTTNGVVRWVYSMSEVLLAPIREVLPSVSYSNTYVLEFRVLFAMVVIAVFGYLVMVLVNVLPKPKSPSTGVKSVLKRLQ